ncbi:MAG: YgjP-like metallopeptidase domain-containing protein [Candidatus Izemoplasmataceae bacterium]
MFVHEATHLFYPNHSQNFYHHLARYIKNHREMKQTLESTRKLFYQTSTD